MDSFTFQEDIMTHSQDADTFPDGVKKAHDALREKLPANERRHYYGVSWPSKDGGIVYKALAEKLEGEDGFGLDSFTIKNGPYISFYINNFREDTSKIGEAFKILVKQHEVDPNGYCLEWYMNDHDVKCMVPLGTAYRPFTGANDAPI